MSGVLYGASTGVRLMDVRKFRCAVRMCLWDVYRRLCAIEASTGVRLMDVRRFRCAVRMCLWDVYRRLCAESGQH